MSRITVVILAAAFLIGLGALVPSSAIADGDPASDVLSSAAVYDPPDTSGAQSQLAGRLKATVEAMNRAGYPLKVALIPSSGDLGSASPYWGDPEDYASKFLGIELSVEFPHSNLLVVMPQGYGLYVPAREIPQGDRKAVANLVAPGSRVIAGALALVQRLAADNGVSLPRNLHVPAVAHQSSSVSAAGSAAFGVGLAMVLVAWWVSLRVRPLRRKGIA